MCKSMIPEVQKTIAILRVLSADENVRQQAYYREKRLHDEASALGNARDKGIEIGLKRGLEEGREEGRKEGREEGRKEGRKEGREEGRKEGILNTLFDLVGKQIVTVAQAAEQADMSVDEFKARAAENGLYV